ncbi:MAG: peptidylprolyl isomerase [Opitutaceae bacterium]|nr:peptidylprolyl isomerase [Opitutaceae bacterium]
MSCFRGLRPRTCALALSALTAFGIFATVRAQTPATPPSDRMNQRYANGIVAIAEDKIITVEDVRRELTAYLPEVQRQSLNEKEFYDKLEELQDSIIQAQIDRVLIVKEFYKPKDGDESNRRQVPANIIDNEIAETLIAQFDGDRSKYLAWLRARGMSQKEYRKEVEEDIIYNYMRQQQARSATTISPVKIEEFYSENKEKFYQEDQVHLRLIQFSRGPNDTDDNLRAKAMEVVNLLKGGAKFEDLARQYGSDSKRNKGGDWGWQKRSDLKKEFSEVLFTMNKGQFSDPIIVPEGSFVLYVEDRKVAGIQPLDEVRDQVEGILKTQNARQAQERWLERLRRNAYVKHF